MFAQHKRITDSHYQRAEAMSALRRQGMTLQAIGDIWGVSRGRVQQVLADHEIRRRKEMRKLARWFLVKGGAQAFEDFS